LQQAFPGGDDTLDGGGVGNQLNLFNI